MQCFIGGQNQRDQFIWESTSLAELLESDDKHTTFLVRTKEERDMLQGYLLIYGSNTRVIVRDNIIKHPYWSNNRFYRKVKLIST